MKKITTPENITELRDNEVFVFGSNWQGNHIGWAAKQAMKFWAIIGQPEWLQGQSYAINTMDWLDIIKEQLERFSIFASDNIDKTFYLTKIGCWIAWYKEEDIKNILPKLPINVILPYWR